MTPPLRQAPMGEFGLIGWIRERAAANARTRLGIGDDCAALQFSAGAEVLVTTDMLLEGRHFRLDETGLGEVGYKAMAVNLSDIAAMAGLPVAALVAVALPRDRAVQTAQEIMAGMMPLADRFGVALVGGDTNAWDGPLVISMTLLGESTPPGPARRQGARPGDAILVTGPLGGRLLGRHLRPTPRVFEGIALQKAATLHAMIDISDGLASDLTHILDESGSVGAILDAGAIPIHPDAVRMSRQDGKSALDHALNDGEDFELCVVVAEDDAERILAGHASMAGPGGGAGEEPVRVALHRVGEVTAEPGLRLRIADGSTLPIRPKGFDHLLPEGR